MASAQHHQMEKIRIKTGIFGGTFDPIHIGHLALANYICEFCGLDEIWFMVSPQNPFKKHHLLSDDQLRLEMVRAAISDYPHFRASDFEFALPRPSYTAETLRRLTIAYPERDFTLIIGADNWISFRQWKEPEEIIRNHPILIYPRPGYAIDVPIFEGSVKLISSPILEISSSFIRQALAVGKDIRYFLHPEVYRLIREKKLYTTTEF